ncbi:ABC transporter substrate-binding protein [Dongia soli]|uniref:ABC transporter substrate-binding protein n=1 Tax=Dongia soli TaxID=600628 RepID=A0ABU5E7F0_9PROT|nr:ABC transporter substrate-binding protein [Dongia soli]MDY0882089.1 ABC transporter substrate-binding protein [Dongia soli]
MPKWLIPAVLSLLFTAQEPPSAAAAATAPAVAPAIATLTVALPETAAPRTIGFYMALADHLFADAGLQVRFIAPADRTPAQMLAEGKADLAVDTMSTALRLREEGAPIQHIAQFFQQAGLALFCRRPIRAPADLRGTSIGIRLDHQESSFYAWMNRLNISTFGEENGVTLSQQADDLQALADHRLDCITSTAYLIPRQLKIAGLKAKDLTVFRYEDLDVETLEDGLYARAEDLHDPARLDRFARFLAAARQGWQQFHDNRSAALRLLTGLSDKTAQQETEQVGTVPAKPVNSGAGIDRATLAESLKAVDVLLNSDKQPIGKLNPESYDRSVNVLLTGAPDPVLARAPAGALSDAVWWRLGAVAQPKK